MPMAARTYVPTEKKFRKPPQHSALFPVEAGLDCKIKFVTFARGNECFQVFAIERQNGGFILDTDSGKIKAKENESIRIWKDDYVIQY